jgi:hypothetical protein
VNARVRGFLVLGLATAIGACARSPKDTGPQPVGGTTPTGAPQPSAVPVDHLEPGELVEGTQSALGVTLPRVLDVRESYVDLVSAFGPVSVHALVRYLTAHLDGGSLREGAEAATFEHVSARGKPEQELLVRVTSEFGGSRLEIHKVTHPAGSSLLDEASRWRQVGLTPQGKVLDPSHLE